MNLPQRKSTRLKNYNYSQNGAYFITMCTHNRKCLLSHIVGAIHESPENTLTLYGKCAEKYICEIENKYPNVKINKYVIMPNHIHLLLSVNDGERAIRESPLHRRSVLSKVVGYIKMNSSKDIHSTYKGNIWQRNYHDHIIRSERDYKKIWEYIDTNVLKWEKDCFYAR